MKVLFLCPYPPQSAPSQRFRFEQYFRYLQDKGKGIGIDYKVQTFLDKKAWNVLYKKGHSWQKFWGVVLGFFRRTWQMLNLRSFNFVFIHREAAPIGPPVYEWWITKVWRKKIIYDFDDAIWLPNTSDENWIARGLKWHRKTALICKWAWKVSAGNEYLCAHARKYNNSVVLNPTTIDLEYHSLTSLLRTFGRNGKDVEISNSRVDGQDAGIDLSLQEKATSSPLQQAQESPEPEVVIGWTGTHSTAVYLREIVQVINILGKRYNIAFLVISNQRPKFQISNLSTEDSSKVDLSTEDSSKVGLSAKDLSKEDFKYQKWSLDSEIEDLQQIDIGVMPMPDNEWTRGKCGFKALQFMALEIPVVASPAGVNKDIIRDGVNGFLADGEEEWIQKLSMLIESEELRNKMGKKGRKTVIEKYSTISNQNNFLSLFNISS